MKIFTQAKVSPAGQVNSTDLKKIARDTAIFFAAPVLMYLAQVQGSLSQDGIVTLNDLVPSLMTIGAIQGWGISIIINFFLKFSNLNERKIS